MALSQPRKWLVTYDVREPRRLKRVHALLTKAAVPVQYSVFAAAGSTPLMKRLAAAVERLIDVRADDVRFYSIPAEPTVYALGPTMLPDAVLLLDDRTDLGPLLGRGASRRGGRAPSAGALASARRDGETGAGQRDAQP
jgi:CRISPR-associated protein Cas2